MDRGDGACRKGAGFVIGCRVDGVALDGIHVHTSPRGVSLNYIVLVTGHRGAGLSRGRRGVRDREAPGHRCQRRGAAGLRRGGLDSAAFIKDLLRGARAGPRRGLGRRQPGEVVFLRGRRRC